MHYTLEKCRIWRRAVLLFIAACLLVPALPLATTSAAAVSGVSSGQTTFYLHDDGNGFGHYGKRYDWANTSIPYNPLNPNFISPSYQGIELNATGTGSSFRWVASPAAGGQMSLRGDVNVTLYMTQSNTSSGSYVSFQLQLQNGTSPSLSSGSVIAQASTGTMQLVPDQRVVFTLPISGSYTLSAGSYLLLNITRTDGNANTSVYVGFDYNSTPSCFSLSITHRLGPISLTLPAPSQSFDNQPYTILANASDLLGSNDISSATASVTGPQGQVYVGNASMRLFGSSQYNSSFIYSANLTYGNYTLNVTVYTRSNLTGYFQLLSYYVNFTVLPSLGSFTVSAPASVQAGSMFRLGITALSDNGQVMAGFNGSASILFVYPNGTSLRSSSVLSSDANFSYGFSNVSEAVYSAGTFTVGVVNGTAYGIGGPLNVTATAVHSIDISPAAASITAGQQIQFNASGLDKYGNKNTSWSPVWSVISGNGTITSGGLFTSYMNGTAEIGASDSLTGVYSSANVTVSPSMLFRLVLTSSGSELLAGQTYFFSVAGQDYYGNPVPLGRVAWETNAGMLFPNGTAAMLEVTRSTMEGGWVEAFSGGLSAVFSFNVTPSAFSPQELLQIPVQSWPSGGSWSFNLTDYFSDPAGSQLEWFLTGGSTLLYAYGAGSMGNTQVVLVPYGHSYGHANLTILVQNSLGYSVTETFQANILPGPQWINSLPQYITVPASSYYSINFTYFLNCSPYSPSSLSISTSSPYVYSNGLMLTYFFPASTISVSFAVVITAADPDNVSSSIVQIITVSSSAPPSVNTAGAPPSSLTIDRGDNTTLEYPLETYFISQNALSFNVVADGAVVYLARGNILHIYSPASSFVSRGTILIMAETAAGEYAFLMIRLNMVSVAAPPSVLPLPSVYVRFSTTGNSNYAFPLEGYVQDTYVPLDQVIVVTGSAYITFSSGNFSLLFSMPAAANGSASYISPYWFNTSIVFVGGSLQNLSKDSVTVPLSVHVSSVPPPGPAYGKQMPSFVMLAENSVYTALNLSHYITAPAGEQLSYSASAVPNLIVSISTDGDVSLIPGSYFHGNERIMFDVNSSSGFFMFSILAIVYPVYIPPVVSLPDILSVNSSSSVVNISGYISNPNGEPITVQAFGSGVTVFGEQMLIVMPSGVSQETVNIVITTPFGSAIARQVTVKLVSQFPSIYVILFYSLLIMMIVVGALLIYQRLIPKPFQLNSILLIHNDGRLISHSHSRDYGGIDRDILVGMFTAIQDFVSTSFPEMGGERQTLNRIELGKFSIYVIRGMNAFMLAIYSGQPPRGWPQQMGVVLSRIEQRYQLADWDGKQESIEGISEQLAALFPGSIQAPAY